MDSMMLLDTDIGDDIDDAFALSLCLRHPKIRLAGISTVKGNTLMRAALAGYLIRLAGGKCETAAGTRDSLDSITEDYVPNQFYVLGDLEQKHLGGRSDGVRFMAEATKTYDDLILVTIGPLTNVARFILEFPEEFKRITRLVIMGGHMIEGRDDPEYNFASDPRATKIVMSSRKPKLVVGLDVTLKCMLSKHDQDTIFGKNTPLTNALMRMTQLWKGSLGSDHEPIMHDPLAVISAVEDFIEFDEIRIDVDAKGNCLRSEDVTPCQFAREVNRRDFIRRLVNIIE